MKIADMKEGGVIGRPSAVWVWPGELGPAPRLAEALRRQPERTSAAMARDDEGGS